MLRRTFVPVTKVTSRGFLDSLVVSRSLKPFKPIDEALYVELCATERRLIGDDPQPRGR